MGIPQPKPRHGFSPNLLSRVSGDNCCRGNTKDFWVVKFVGIPQHKAMHGCSLSFQDMLTETGSKAD